MNNPEISVIIPVYNGEKYLTRCLDSIGNQTFQNIEILCIDDCSTDATPDIIQAYGERDDRLKYIRHLKNIKETGARNTGIMASKGNFLSFVDSDDWIEENFLEILHANITRYDADIACANVQTERASGPDAIWDKEIFGYEPNQIFQNKHIMLKKILKNGSCWHRLYRSPFIKNNKIFFDENINSLGDLVFSLKAFLNTDRITYANACYHYFYHPDSMVHNSEYIRETAYLFTERVLNLFASHNYPFLTSNEILLQISKILSILIRNSEFDKEFNSHYSLL